MVVSAGNLNLQSKPLTGATSVALDGGVLIIATITGNALGANNNAKISFNDGVLQYNVDGTDTDYSARFSTDPGQKYKIFVISAKSPVFSSDFPSVGATLEKSGPGTLVLGTANTFTGATTRFNGTLQLNDALAHGYRATDDPADLAGFDVAVISVPTPLRDGMPDLSFIEQAGATLGAHLRPGACVVLAMTPDALKEMRQESGALLREQADIGSTLDLEDVVLFKRRLTKLTPDEVPSFSRPMQKALAEKVRKTHRAVRGPVDVEDWDAVVRAAMGDATQPRHLVRRLTDELEARWWAGG